MRNLTKVATAVAVASGLAMPAHADLMAMDVAHVFMDVVPNISIGGGGGSSGTGGSGGGTCSGYAGVTDGICWNQNVDLGDHQTGLIPGWITFFVEANVQEIQLGCGATDLFKGNVAIDGDPNDTHDDPIPLYEPAGCTITMVGASPAGGGSSVAQFGIANDDVLNTPNVTQAPWPVHRSTDINFHANFPEPSRDVTIHLFWEHDNPEQRVGEYSGFVKLYAMIPGI